MLNVDQTFVESINFAKCQGLVPTIVCDAGDSTPRMLAYSTAESLSTALRERAGVYWSRSRQHIWRKGEVSGRSQRLIHVAADCDRDAIIFYVEQVGTTCHFGTDTCFDSRGRFTWTTLAARVRERANGVDGVSYTRQLLAQSGLLQAKLREEAAELANAQTPEEVAWECADLLYFMTVKLQHAGAIIADVMAKLAERAK